MPADLLGPGGRGMRGATGTDSSRARSETDRLRRGAKKAKTKKDILTGVGIGLAALATVATAGAASPALAASMGMAGAGKGLALTGAGLSMGAGLSQMAAGGQAQKEASFRQAAATPPNAGAQREY